MKISLLQRVQKANLMQHLGDPGAVETLFKNYEAFHGRVGAKDVSEDEEKAAAANTLESDAESAVEQEAEDATANGENASAHTAAEETSAETAAEETSAETPAAPAAETGPEPFAEIALAHINNFYSASTVGNT